LELTISDTDNPTLRNLDKCGHRHLFKDFSQVAKLQSTVKSQLVECRYYLIASVDYDNCLCCSGKPTIEIPIIIYIPDIFNDLKIYRPKDWNPIVMPSYEFYLPSSEELGLNGGFSMNVKITNEENENSSKMIMDSYEPIKTNTNTNSNINVNFNTNTNSNYSNNNNNYNNSNNNQMMMGGTEPMNNNSNGMMMGGSEPKKNY
jgi:hypothetical protein